MSIGDVISAGGAIAGAFGGGDGGAGAAADAQVGASKEAAELQKKYAEMAIAELRDQFGKARTDVLDYYGKSFAQLEPYNIAGMNALDQYLGTTGTPKVKGGSFFLRQALEADAARKKLVDAQVDQQALYSELRGLSSSTNDTARNRVFGTNVSTANDRPETYNLEHSRQMLDMARADYGLWSANGGEFWNSLAGQVKDLSRFDALLKEQKPIEDLPEAQKAIVDAYQSGNLPLETESGASALGKYFNTPEYGLIFGNEGEAVDPNASPLERFQKDPGYIFQQQEAADAANRTASKGGYLNSPRALAELQAKSQGIADTTFDRYKGQLADSFRSYQNRLAQLAGLGAGIAGQESSQAVNTGVNLGNISTRLGENIADVYTGIGSTQANSALSAGQARASSYLAEGAQQNQMFGNIQNIGSMLNKFGFGG